MYILTACIGLDRRLQAVFSTGRLARAPGGQAAGERACVLESRASSARATARGARAPVGQTTTSGSALFFGRSREVSRLASGTLLRADGMAGGVLGRLADVDQHRLLAVDQLHRIGGADLRAAPSLRPASARAAGRRRPARRRTDTSCRGTKFKAWRAAGARSGKSADYRIRPPLARLPPSPHCAGPTLTHLRRPCTSSSCSATANRPGTWRTASPAGPTSTSRRPASSRRSAAGRLLKEAGYEFDVAYTSVLKRAIWTLWHALDEMDRTWLPVAQRLAPERAPLRRAAGPEQGRDRGEVRRRAGAGLAAQLRHAAAAARRRDDPRSERSDPRYAQLAPGRRSR